MNGDDTAGREFPDEPGPEIAALRRELEAAQRRVAELDREVTQLRARLDRQRDHATGTGAARPAAGAAAPPSEASAPSEPEAVDQRSPSDAKIALYRSLFAGRDDVYSRRWENLAQGTHGWAPARGRTSGAAGASRETLPLTDDVVRAHLEGPATIGLYPLLRDDSCRLLACDFDKATWRLDAQAYLEAAAAAGVPAAVELSRSGNGAHVWTFFTAPVAATEARALGSALLRHAMAIRGELELDSYDRFFPSQDYLPDRGFGNLIGPAPAGRLPPHSRHDRLS